jgi:3-methyladenine DNA glycosylase AlkD
MLSSLREEIKKAGSPDRAKVSTWFFKTGPGQYGEGDMFVGITVPEMRKIAIKFQELSLPDTSSLIKSKIHEERLIALLILVSKFTKGDEKSREAIYTFYLSHTEHINNWDLVDLSADKIVGEYLKTHDRSVLQKLAKSESLWERRIAIIATFQFIKDLKKYEDTFIVADILLQDKHDLIQKAVGWMLREVGKRISEKVEEDFLKARYKTMPRTALRYAIERFPIEKRKKYLLGEI